MKRFVAIIVLAEVLATSAIRYKSLSHQILTDVTIARPATLVNKSIVALPVKSTIELEPSFHPDNQPHVMRNLVFSFVRPPYPNPAVAVSSNKKATAHNDLPVSRLLADVGITVPTLPIDLYHLIVVGAFALDIDTVCTIIVKDSFNSINASPGTKSLVSFCGHPPYNERQSCINQNYFMDLLSQCEVEDGAIMFSRVIGLLGICIILVNALLPIVAWRNREMRMQYDYIKVSLAFADMITGVLLLTSVLPNVSLLGSLTLRQAVQYLIDDANSPIAIISGSLLTVATQASLLHLMFLSIEHFSAIKWPFWHIKRKTSSVMLTLAAIWIASFVSSFIPAAFPEYFEYQMQPTLLIYVMTIKPVADAKGTEDLDYHGSLYASIAFFLPYAVAVMFFILTSIAVYQKLAPDVRKFDKQHGDGDKSKMANVGLKSEIAELKTIFSMIAAFTITFLPFAIAMPLFMFGVLQCSNFTIPYVVAFYFGMLNRLMNALIYTVRDRKFRTALRNVFTLGKASGKTSPTGQLG